MAVGTDDGALKLFDISGPVPSPLPNPPSPPPLIATLQSSGTAPAAVSLSSDGSVVAAGSGNLVLTWQQFGSSWQPKYNLVGHTGAVQSVATSSNGRHVHSGGCDATVRAWDLTVGAQEGPAMPIGGASTCAMLVAVGADGRSVAAAGNGDSLIRLWASWSLG